jgi:hypothetical protein
LFNVSWRTKFTNLNNSIFLWLIHWRNKKNKILLFLFLRIVLRAIKSIIAHNVEFLFFLSYLSFHQFIGRLSLCPHPALHFARKKQSRTFNWRMRVCMCQCVFCVCVWESETLSCYLLAFEMANQKLSHHVFTIPLHFFLPRLGLFRTVLPCFQMLFYEEKILGET